MQVTILAAVLAVVAFKDAGKIKSWDAWGDNGATPTKTVFMNGNRGCCPADGRS